MTVPLSLEGKIALVTGGSRGIGAATVRLFVEAGAKVLFSYRAARDAAEALVAELGEGRCAGVAAELDTAASGETLVRSCVARYGRIDALVVNHGVYPPEDVAIDAMSEAHWRRTMGVNLDSVFGIVKHGVAAMKRQTPPARGPRGHVVLVSSTAGQRGEAFHVDYATTKGALISMTKSLSTELVREGIHVNCVAPGWVDTDMAAPALDDPSKRAWVLSSIPIGRVGTPAEIAGPILFLCTEHAGFISGEIFNVNGGAVLVG